jgi:hypothetical protein
MEKHILTWSYWLGLASTVIALVLRLLNALGLLVPQVVKQGQTIWYMSFYKGALLFLLIAVATASCTWARSQRAQ